MKTLDEIIKPIPKEISKSIQQEFQKIYLNFLKQEWSQLSLHGGRFAEVLLRLIEYHITSNYTPMDGKSKLDRSKTISLAKNSPQVVPDSIRIFIPRIIETLLDLRNNRNVAHIGNIDVHRLDASYTLSCTTWALAEIIRTFSDLPENEIQEIIDNLALRPNLIIEYVDNTPIILNTKLSYEDKALLMIYYNKEKLSVFELSKLIGYANKYRFKKSILKKLQNQSYIYYDDNNLITLLSPGIKRTEEIINKIV